MTAIPFEVNDAKLRDAFFRELLSRLDSIELAGELTFVHSTLVTGPKTLPIRYQLR